MILLLCSAAFAACTRDVFRARIGRGSLGLELAVSPSQRAKGLMFRMSLPRDAGMLFVFPDTGRRAFWMKNTYIPLSIAFLDRGLRVIALFDMKPHDRTPVGPEKPAMYVLEVNKGWFRRNSVRVGSRLRPGKSLNNFLSRYRSVR